MKVQCPNCQASYNIPERSSNNEAKCPNCGQSLISEFTNLPKKTKTVAVRQMDIQENIEELQQASDYGLMKTTLPLASGGSIGLGIVVAIFGSYLRPQLSDMSLLVVILTAGFLLFCGVWMLISPSKLFILFGGIAFTLVGTLCVVISFIRLGMHSESISMGGHFNFNELVLPIVFGFIQIGWGISLLCQYPQFHKVTSEKPSEDVLKLVSDITTSIDSDSWKKSDDIIEFTSVLGTRTNWKARLFLDKAIFVKQGKKNVIFARKEDVEITDKGKVVLQKTRKMMIKVKNSTEAGLISPESLNRYEKWKKGKDV